eukprot:TRINITY_DN3782_c1_g3_i1.p1 TRINITY_DN3782_c1_g3~~TRINITY_DN3782_c1_g3_i1.p1  ORF type:complete len:644 (+),score=228.96 TRINITY_DN3782_c1_g3_i1:32-1933(+)
MSHEIRTPMNGVIGGTDLLLASGNNLTAEQKEVLGIIRHSSEAMLMLINDILDLSKIEAGKLELSYENIFLRDFVDNTVDVLGEQALSKGLDIFVYIAPDVPHLIRGDLLRLRQILLNLLSNAIKFTNEGQVILMLSIAKDVKLNLPQWCAPMGGETQTIHLILRDSGIGIPPHLRSKLFLKFSQVRDHTSKQIGGTGLGLAISKSLVEMMGGRMWIADEPQLIPNFSGSEFHFQIPCETGIVPPEKLPLHGITSSTPFNGDRILVIKSNPITAEMLKDVLLGWGFEVDLAHNIETAFSFLEHPPAQGYKFVLFDCSFLFRPADLSTRWSTPVQRRVEISTSISISTSTPFQLELLEQVDHLTRVKLKSIFIILVSLGDRQKQKILETHADVMLSNPIKISQFYRCLLNLQRDPKGRGLESDSRQYSPVTSSMTDQLEKPFAEQHPLRILIAEDNMVNQRVIQKMLIKLGFKSRDMNLCDSGKKALDAVKKYNGMPAQHMEVDGDDVNNNPYDVVLMDVFMPEMDGLEATTHIRSDATIPPHRQPFIIALTANAMRGDEDKCKDAGMELYLTKPLTLQHLEDALKNTHRQLEQRRQARQDAETNDAMNRDAKGRDRDGDASEQDHRQKKQKSL